MTSRASAAVIFLAASAAGTFSTAPALSRFMLSPTNASGLPRNKDTSIWSSDTPWRCVRAATPLSESPRRTRYSSAIAAAGAPATAGAVGACATRGGGAVVLGTAATAGAGDGAVGVKTGEADGEADGKAAGAAVANGAVTAAGAAATRAEGGSNNIVYSRTKRPDVHVASTITSIKGSSTAPLLLTRK